MFTLPALALALVLRLWPCAGLPQRYHHALRQDAVCYFEPLIVFDPIPLSNAALQCTANGFTLTDIPPSGQFASALLSLLATNNGPCATPPTFQIALPSCSYFDITLSTGFPAADCGTSLPVMCVLPAPQILTETSVVFSTLTTITTTRTTTVTASTTSTVVFVSQTTTFIFQPTFSTSVVTTSVTSTISFVSSTSTTTTTTIESTLVLSTLSATTTTTTATNFSISQTTTSSTLILTQTLTTLTTDSTTATVTSCPPTSYTTRTQTTTATATVTVSTTVPTATTSLVTASTTVTLTEAVCGGTAGPTTTSACCPPGKRCPKLPKRCLSYGQVQTCKHHERKLLVAFRPATREEASCVCQAVGGALAVLEGEDDLQAAYEVVYSCVGGGGRAWIGQVLSDAPGKHQHHQQNHGYDDGFNCDVDKCNAIRAIDSDFGFVEQAESCQAKFPILCRYW